MQAYKKATHSTSDGFSLKPKETSSTFNKSSVAEKTELIKEKEDIRESSFVSGDDGLETQENDFDKREKEEEVEISSEMVTIDFTREKTVRRGPSINEADFVPNEIA